MRHLKLDSRHLKLFQDRIVGAYHASNLLDLLEIVVANSFSLTSVLIHLRLL